MTKMKFNRDMYYDDRTKPLYSAGIVYEIPHGMVNRWLKRGGVIVEDPKPEVVPVVEAKKPVEAVKEKPQDVSKPDAKKVTPPSKAK